MAKERIPLGLRPRKAVASKTEETIKPGKNSKPVHNVGIVKELPSQKGKTKEEVKKGRPSTKKGKNLVKYSMDIHPELKRAVVKAAAIYDKDVHVMWNEIVYDWLIKEKKKNPGWYATISVKKEEL